MRPDFSPSDANFVTFIAAEATRARAISRGNLLVGKFAVAELVTGIDDFDPDARRIDVGDAAPARLAGVPGTTGFVDEPVHGAVLIDEIMRGNLRFGRGQAVERAFRVWHA